MAMIFTRIMEAEKLTNETLSKVFEKLKKNLLRTGKHNSLSADDDLQDVSRGKLTWVNDLAKQRCICEKWQISVLPYGYALKC